MASGFLFDLSGKRKRALEEDGAEDEVQENKRQHIISEDTNYDDDDDDVPLDPSLEALFNETIDDDGSEEIDDEPEQGEVLWSEDQEGYPLRAVYHADVKKYQTRITEFAVDVTDKLTKVCHEGDDIAKLHAEAVACQRFPEQKKMVIALMGDAGSGKSSLINSILDTPHISQELKGNFGSAITCAITEYTSEFPEQTKKFAAKVEFLDHKQRSKLLKDHLEEYLYFHFKKDIDWTDVEKKEHRDQAQTAEGTFLDLFRGRPSFNNRVELKLYMRTTFENDTSAEVSAKMEVWCDELIATHASSSLLVAEGDRAFQLRREINLFLSSGDSSSREPHLWPLVLKVSVGIRGPRVLKNLIFSDMPGLSDISRVRVKASKNYMRCSDYLWIVVPVMRCVSDSGVDSVLYEFGERFAGRLAMICTKIDDGMKPALFKEKYTHVAKELKNLEKHLERAQESGNRAEEEKIIDYRFAFMVHTRNLAVETQIYEEKSDHFKKSKNGPVFFVSNEHYTWLKGYHDSGSGQAPVQLDAHMTGIPALRRYALSIPAQRMWLSIMTHIQHTSVTFMKSLAIWAARTSADHGAELQKIKEKSTKDIDRSIKAYVVAVREDAMRFLAVTMRDNLDEVAEKAYDYLHDTVREWNWGTIRVVVKREGTFKNVKLGLIQWNEKFKQPTARCLAGKWRELILRERKHMATTEKKIKDDLDALHSRLEVMMEPYNIPEEQFGDLIGAQKHGVTRAVQDYSNNMEKELGNTKQLTQDDMHFGYLAQAMRPTYEEASQITGKGYKDNVMTLFEGFVDQRDQKSPFIRMVDYASRKVDHHATVFTEELHKECDKIYDRVFNSFGGLLTKTQEDGRAVAAVKTALRDYLPLVDAETVEIVKKLQAIERDPRPVAKPKAADSNSEKSSKEDKQQDKSVKVKTEPKSRVKSEIKQEQQ